jgi:hypothetical protein
VFYFWYPPLMDLLFGLLVLAPFIGAPLSAARHWFPHAAFLMLASFLLHAAAVSVVFHTQWWFESVTSLRFLSVVPIALATTLAITAVTVFAARLPWTRRMWTLSAAAGLVSGLVFLSIMEAENLASIAWTAVMFMFWHMAMCVAIFYGRSAGLQKA